MFEPLIEVPKHQIAFPDKAKSMPNILEPQNLKSKLSVYHISAHLAWRLIFMRSYEAICEKSPFKPTKQNWDHLILLAEVTF